MSEILILLVSAAYSQLFNVSTFATGLNSPRGLAFRNGNLLVADSFNSLIKEYNMAGVLVNTIGSGPGFAEGTLATAKFNGIYTLAVAPNGDIFVGDMVNNCILYN